MTSALALDQVSAGYGDARVLRDVSVEVPPMSVVALLGPNGAGKTTLLRCASGVLTPSNGTVTVNGDDLTGVAADRFAGRGVCHVPEGRGIFRSLTVRENLELFAHDRHASELVNRAVEAFPRLGERLQQTAGTLSGGEQQMLALARAYITSPEVVLLDEVSMGLAPNIVDEIFEFIAELRNEAALLIVEQFAHRALVLADVVYVLRRGRIVHVGPPGALSVDDLAQHYLGVDEHSAGELEEPTRAPVVR